MGRPQLEAPRGDANGAVVRGGLERWSLALTVWVVGDTDVCGVMKDK